MNALQVGGLTPFTTIDFPGRLSAVVFCRGCPWRCRYCHNGHLLSRRAPAVMRWGDVMAFLRRRCGLLDGVVFSGGEPTLQRGLAGAITEVRRLGMEIGLHTAGCYPQRLAEVLPLVDWVGLDIKALPEAYPQLTGARGSAERAFASLELLLAAGVPHQVRVTVDERLLPPADLQRLTNLLEGRGVADLVLQRCIAQRALGMA